MKQRFIDRAMIGIAVFTTVPIGAWLFAEFFNIIDTVVNDPPYPLPDIVPVLSALISAVLSSLLVLLYFRQSLILESQRDLQAIEFQPIVKGHVDVVDDVPKFIIRNVGRTAATNVDAVWTFEELENMISFSLLEPSDQYEFPIARADDRRDGEPLAGQEFLDTVEDGSILEHAVSFDNPHNGERRTEEGESNVPSMVRYRAGIVWTSESM